MRQALSGALAAILCTAGCARTRDPLPGFPRIVVWAWERPEDLTSLDPREVGIAFLARTVRLGRDTLTARPRLVPLRHPAGAALMAVVRVESRGGGLPSPDALAEDIARAAEIPGLRALQVDYDAVASERTFYRDMLGKLRARLPAEMPLSMTALVSWCAGDDWLTGLPVAEAVPMLFRMGVPWRGGDFRAGLCRMSVGVATDEPFVRVPRGRRVYIFHPRAWSPEALRAAIREARKWL